MGAFAGPEIVEDGLVLALDVGNKKSYSQNYHPNPLDIYGWYVDIRGNANANNSTITRDSITSPVGNTPLKMVTTGNDSHIGSYNTSAWNLATAKQGQTWTVSVYAKAHISTTGQIFIFEVNSLGSYIQAPAKTINITTEWQRFDYTYTFINANTTHIQTRLDGADTFDGAIIWWDGLQVERNSSVSSFTSVYTGENILDISNNSNNGTLTNGPTYSSSNGGSLVFDGTNDHVSIPYNASLKPTTAITMEAFCYIQDNGANWTSLIQYPINSSSHTPPYFDWAIYLNMPNRLLHTRIDGDSASSPNNVWNFNEWVHVAITFENQSVKYYVNGNNVGSSTVTTTSIVYDADNPVYIGRNGAGSEPFEGKLANIKVYNKALTASEVLQNFNALRGRFSI